MNIKLLVSLHLKHYLLWLIFDGT